MFDGFFDVSICLDKIDSNGDPLKRINGVVDWEIFRPCLEEIRPPKSKSAPGPRGYDNILLFKILILQSLYNLSDAQTETQVLDRLTFKRFLGLKIADSVPDEKTIWLFREDLKKAGQTKVLFEKFEAFLNANGFEARKGQIVDASIISCPKQRNTREENKKIKDDKAPEIEGWSDNKLCQKDTDARWKTKNGTNYFGYSNHISVDVKYKFIRNFEVTNASVHDSQVFEELIDPGNTNADIFADSAYNSAASIEHLKSQGYRPRLSKKSYRNHPLTERDKRGNKRHSKIRCRIEHVFGITAMRMINSILRGVGIFRAKTKIGLRNLAYNLDRFAFLKTSL